MYMRPDHCEWMIGSAEGMNGSNEPLPDGARLAANGVFYLWSMLEDAGEHDHRGAVRPGTCIAARYYTSSGSETCRAARSNTDRRSAAMASGTDGAGTSSM